MMRLLPRKCDLAILSLVAVLAAGVAAARAQTPAQPSTAAPTVTPGQMMPGGHAMQGGQMMQGHMAGRRGMRRGVSSTQAIERRIADLHRRLGITAAEEPQWITVAQVMRDNAQAVAAAATAREEKLATMSAVDNLRSFQLLAQAHADGLDKLADAFASLYATMSDEQKKTADAVFRYQEQRPRRSRQSAAPRQ